MSGPDLAALLADGTETVLLTQASTSAEARLIAERIAAAGGTERPSVNLGPPGSRGARVPEALLEESAVRLVPVRVAWLPEEHAGRRMARFADLLPGQDPYHPNEHQQQRILAREPDRAVVLVGEPATVGSLRRQWAEITGGDDPADFGSYVIRRVTLALDRAEYQLLGPRYKTPSLVKEEILSSRRFRSGLLHVQRGPDEPPPSLAEAGQVLDELVAGWSRRFIDIVPNLGRMIFQRGFDPQIDYDENQVERVRAAMRRHPCIFLWSHRSYLDAPVLAAAMQENGLPPAHVFGGINLAFGPMGAIFRRAGVIFIRRSTRDDPLYKYVLREYVGYVLEKRFNLSWSIEGTRSRTGKMLPPRLGLLAYAADAFLQGRVDDILLQPVSITYDQLNEIAEYAGYARGAQKKPEGFGWFYGFVKAQGARYYGKIYVRFGEPVSLSAFLGPPDGPAAADPAALRLALQKTAFEVAWRINQGMPVTATAILTTILLAMRGTALTFGQIRLGLADGFDYLESRAIPMTASARALTAAEPVRATLDALRQGGLVSYVADGREPVWLIEPEHQLAATFYRNSLIHFLLDTALCEVAVLRAGDDSTDPVGAFWAEIAWLRDLLKYEFYFRERDEHRRDVRREMDRHDPAWEQRLRSGPDEADALLASMRPLVSHVIVRPFVEAYRLVADVLASEDPPDDDAEVIRRALGLGQQYVAQRRLRSSESVSVLLFQTALQLARNRGLFEPAEDLAKRRTSFLNELRDLLRRLDRIEDIAIRRYIADAAVAQAAELGTRLDGGAAGDQGRRVIQAPLGQRLDRMPTGRGRRTGQLPGGPGEPRRGSRLDHAVGGDVGLPRDQVRVAGGLGQRQDRLHARLAPGEGGGPFVPGALGEPRRQPGAQFRPVPRVVPVGQAGQAEAGQQRGIEPRLQGPDRHPLRVRRLVHVIPGHAAVEQVDPALIAPQALGHERQGHGEQRCHPVHDGGVDHLAPPG
jgi:glycerol-3-phosphate O-acyltransferase